ncbi:hypothetical protein [Mesorhizobium sp. ES1-1]|uniref:hypothetical protein n=1 Tax=Mesorhizobium sp. ES1-1 TaxID=2876629 RepID=UPI001CCA29F3|nr:hypothetical protein [Mesorhizobium sp. ES1-1]MBZ9675112.1 hypothetical protein [Mesorhizobium sp. ES1-1]
MIFAMASPRNTKKRWTGMDSADSFLPFQDWRWLVTRRGANEKPIMRRAAPSAVRSHKSDRKLTRHGLLAMITALHSGLAPPPGNRI